MEFSKKKVEDDFLVLAGLVEEDPFSHLKLVDQEEDDEEPDLEPPKKKAKSSVLGPKKRKKTTKPKPITVKNFFPTLKNSQGFDMHLCRYEASIRDYVYVPRKYHKITKAKLWIDRSKFCPSCKLQPCINVEHFEEIGHKSFEVHSAHDKAKEEGRRVRAVTPVRSLERYIMSLMTKYFGREYMNRNGMPECVIEEACKWNDDWKKSKNECR